MVKRKETKVKKVRKPRKPMSEEQKVAASERLKKAREARKEKNPDYGMTNVHESLRDLPDDHQLHPDKVKLWIKTQKDLLRSARANIRVKSKGAEAEVASHEGYIRACQKYLRDGDWVDDFYGEYQEKRIRWRCRVPAYFWTGPNAGKIKRSIGVYYDDIADVWTKEMFEEDGYVLDAPTERKTVKKRRKRRKTNK